MWKEVLGVHFIVYLYLYHLYHLYYLIIDLLEIRKTSISESLTDNLKSRDASAFKDKQMSDEGMCLLLGEQYKWKYKYKYKHK